ncbi:DUF4062 domain-containing protein [Terasakiella pusilla]|uniref:DUF4062 domain-containing protein n=1 Tax=Terasakiella pusilla TaxID=64973 RepID=UPI00048F350B|nr:DUF4062 domain-containing protein [Terasakiella pusilla]
MEKRYQVFVSSTYTDLKEERQAVTQTLMEMDCIPAGMELFPAADEEQWEFIKKVIDDCDYYLLIIGGRYGSVTDDGISYTQKEYEYAVSKGLPVVALLHGDPGKISADKTELDPELREKLDLFRETASTGRLVKYWKDASDLPGMVSLSLNKNMKMYPAIGWVRANVVANEDLLLELNRLRTEKEELQAKLAEISETANVIEFDDGEIASLDDSFTLSGHHVNYDYDKFSWYETKTWREIFGIVAPYIYEGKSTPDIKYALLVSLYGNRGSEGYTDYKLNDQDFQTVVLQFMALRLVTVVYIEQDVNTTTSKMSLTKNGEKLLFETRVVRKQ